MKEMKEGNVGEKGPGGTGTAWFSARLLLATTTQTLNVSFAEVPQGMTGKNTDVASTTVLLISIQTNGHTLCVRAAFPPQLAQYAHMCCFIWG